MVTIRNLVFLFVVLLSIQTIAVAEERSKVYLIALMYDQGNLELISVRGKAGYAPDRYSPLERDYSAKIVSFDDQVLYSFEFDVPNEYLLIFPRGGGEGKQRMVSIDRVNLSLTIPYFTTGKKIEIFNLKGDFVLSVNVSSLATCNLNKICDAFESTETCPEDCAGGTGDDVCELTVDGNCKRSGLLRNIGFLLIKWFPYLTIIVIVFVLLIPYREKKRRRRRGGRN